MFIIKMVKSIDDILENSESPEEILPKSLDSLIFGLNIYTKKLKTKHRLNEHSIEFKLYDKNVNIFIGEHISNKIKKHEIDAMLIYSEDLEFSNSEDDSPDIKNYIDGVIKIDEDEDTLFDILDRVFICFKEDEDYRKFVKHVLQGVD